MRINDVVSYSFRYPEQAEAVIVNKPVVDKGTPIRRGMKKFPLHIIAFVIIASYSALAISPFAIFAAKSGIIAHAVNGQCTGECALCGCSPERSASHTCCCWKNKQQDEHEHEHSQQASCCKNKEHGSKTVLKCDSPCGSNKLLASWNGETYEQVPNRFSTVPPVFHADDLATFHRKLLTDRQGDPPDPPPKLSMFT